MSDWSDTPPTGDGWYWLTPRRAGQGADVIAEFANGVWWIEDSDHSAGWMARNYQLGSRIPSNAELLAMRQQIATQGESLAWHVRVRDAMLREDNEVQVTLGRALDYPVIYVDPATNAVVSSDFPGAVKTDDVCTGDHVTATLAIEAARKIATLTAERDAAEAELEAATQRLIDAEVA